ncbi:hypothetical protein D3C87_1826940 [compost metagenome]
MILPSITNLPFSTFTVSLATNIPLVSCVAKIIVLPFSTPVAVPVIRYSSFPTLLQENNTTVAESNKIIFFIIN